MPEPEMPEPETPKAPPGVIEPNHLEGDAESVPPASPSEMESAGRGESSGGAGVTSGGLMTPAEKLALRRKLQDKFH